MRETVEYEGESRAVTNDHALRRRAGSVYTACFAASVAVCVVLHCAWCVSEAVFFISMI